jgi:hypothetical protein
MRLTRQGYCGKLLFNKKVLQFLNSKEKQIACVVKYLKIPRKELELVYFHPKNGIRKVKKIKNFKG